MPFAHPLSVYPVSKAPRKVPTFRERKEVSSRACRPICSAQVCMKPMGAPLVAMLCLLPMPQEGWQKSWPAQWLWAFVGCQLLLGSQAGAVVAACASDGQLWAGPMCQMSCSA